MIRPDLYAVARCWGLWRRWLAYERHERAMGRPAPERWRLYALWRHIRREMEDDHAERG